MTFGPDAVIACPSCGAPERVFTLRTSNNFFDSYWTDGYASRPCAWAQPELTRCHACGRFYWLEDAPVLGRMPERGRKRWFLDVDGIQEEEEPREAVPEAWEKAPQVTRCGVEALLEALAAGVADTEEREILLRTQVLWISNHKNRNPRRKRDRQKTPQARKNMVALLALHRVSICRGMGPRRCRRIPPRLPSA